MRFDDEALEQARPQHQPFEAVKAAGIQPAQWRRPQAAAGFVVAVRRQT